MREDNRIDGSLGQIRNTEYGTIRVDDEVVQMAAALAVDTVEGIVGTLGTGQESFIGSMTDSLLGKKNSIKGVRVDYKDGGYTIIINIKVKYGYCIPDLAHEIQRKVKQEVEQMTESKVRAVDLFIQGMDFSRTDKLEMEEQHA